MILSGNEMDIERSMKLRSRRGGVNRLVAVLLVLIAVMIVIIALGRVPLSVGKDGL